MNIITELIILFIVSIFCGSNAYAKCALGMYIISGEIKDIKSENMIPNVKLYIFLDDQKFSLNGEFVTTNSHSAISDNIGKYEAKNYFNTFSGGSFYGDECNSEPKKVEIIAVHENYYIQKFIYNTGELILIEQNPDYKKFNLSPLFLSPLEKNK